jgi:hypothetical protein
MTEWLEVSNDIFEDEKYSNYNYMPVNTAWHCWLFLFLCTKDINAQQRPDDCQQKFLSQNNLSLSSLDNGIDIQGPLLKCYKHGVFSIHFAKHLDNYRTTKDHELLFQMICSSLFIICRRVMQWHKTPRQTHYWNKLI